MNEEEKVDKVDTEETAEAEKPAGEIKEEPEKTEKEKKKAKKEAAKEKPEEKKEEPPKRTPEQELASANDRYLRLMAEYDNFRKRSQKEKESLYGDIKANAVKEFLPVYDNLVRALAAETADEAYRKGVEMIMAQFNKTLEKLGVTEIKCLGEKFDPQFHNAVMHVDDEEKGENEIVEVFQKGFMLGDKVIRFAMVKVAN
ncbi:MAG: nucleotide exchange factor GrpE [Oscillospiraceae bacterium]|nr:nucleotide exchange factor GrpE [Oscillospiraceae bacterium]